MYQENLEYTRDDGKVIRGVLFKQFEEDGKKPVVIFSHGFGANYRMFLHHAEEIVQAGYHMFLFDFCGGGMETVSDGTMQEMTLKTEINDLETIIEGLSARADLDMQHLFLWGESQGGMVSALTAAKTPELVKAMVLWYPAFVIPDDSRKRIATGVCDVFGIPICPDYDPVAVSIDLERDLPGFTGPVLLIHGDQDPVVPFSYSQRAVGIYANASLIRVEGASHGYNEKEGPYARRAGIAFMDFCMAKEAD